MAKQSLHGRTPRVAVLGMGRAGRDLVQLLAATGGVVWAWNRSPDAPDVAGLPVSSGSLAPAREADAVLLAVSDGAIAGVARALGKVLEPGSVLLHLSGAVASDRLLAAGPEHACASMHPLQTLLGDGNVPTPFPWILEGDARAVAVAGELANAMQCPSAVLPTASKARYHLAATMASNLLVGLADMVYRQAARAGLPEDRIPHLFAPLMDTTLRNVVSQGPHRALTGPVRRGDADTICTHLEVLGSEPEDLACYRRLSTQLVDLAIRDGLDDRTAERLRDQLADDASCPGSSDD